MGGSRINGLARLLLAAPGGLASERINLRLWFAVFVIWMVGLAAIALWALGRYEEGAAWGQRVWLLAIYVFYLSLCCTFLPLPTTWIVMLLASDFVGLAEGATTRVLIVASTGAFATCMANLSEYHVFTFVLRFGWAAKVRQTRVYRWAAGWFATSPFAVVSLFAFLPIPVDVVRWLAITYGYPRSRYFAAYYVGRWPRYALLAAATTSLGLSVWHIAVIQAALVLLALAKIAPGMLRKLRSRRAPAEKLEGTSAAGQAVPSDDLA